MKFKDFLLHLFGIGFHTYPQRWMWVLITALQIPFPQLFRNGMCHACGIPGAYPHTGSIVLLLSIGHITSRRICVIMNNLVGSLLLFVAPG